MRGAERPAPKPPAPKPPEPVPSPAMKAAVREAVGSDPERRLPSPKIEPAVVEPPHPAVPPPAAAVSRRRTGWGYAAAWALGIGVGAVAAGAFIGFLVNGPPGYASRHRVVADVVPPTPDVPPPTAQEIVNSGIKTASTTPLPPAAVTPTNAPVVTATTETATPATAVPAPPVSPAKPAAQQATPPSPPLPWGDIREAQGRLKSLGFDPGPIDGSPGPLTTAAVTKFEQTHGLPQTGVIDKDVLAALRREPGSTLPPPPAPLPAPAPAPRPRPQTNQSAATPPAASRQSNPFLDALNRMFSR
jgi:peptidoglycan hydrolase-like protein with peptidoglycan-binding domain